MPAGAADSVSSCLLPLRFLATTAAVPAATAGAATWVTFLPANQAMRAFRNLVATVLAVPAAFIARCFLDGLRRRLGRVMPCALPGPEATKRFRARADRRGAVRTASRRRAATPRSG